MQLSKHGDCANTPNSKGCFLNLCLTSQMFLKNILECAFKTTRLLDKALHSTKHVFTPGLCRLFRPCLDFGCRLKAVVVFLFFLPERFRTKIMIHCFCECACGFVPWYSYHCAVLPPLKGPDKG